MMSVTRTINFIKSKGSISFKVFFMTPSQSMVTCSIIVKCSGQVEGNAEKILGLNWRSHRIHQKQEQRSRTCITHRLIWPSLLPWGPRHNIWTIATWNCKAKTNLFVILPIFTSLFQQHSRRNRSCADSKQVQEMLFTLHTFQSMLQKNQDIDTQSYVGKLEALIHLFNCCFQDFEQCRQQCKFLQIPLLFQWTRCPDYLLELNDLQSSDAMRAAFREKLCWDFTSLFQRHLLIWRILIHARIFGSTYHCKHTFSQMKLNKTTDDHLE